MTDDHRRLAPIVAERAGDFSARNFEANGAYWREHIENNRALILAGAQRCAPDSATALGAAGGYEFPLADLAERFAVLNLVDIDGKHLEAALGKIPPELQKKVRLHPADVSGGAVSRFLEAGLRAVDAAGTAQDALTALLPLARRLEEEITLEANPEWRASYVISSGLSTQIIAFPRGRLREALSAKFGTVDDEILALYEALRPANEKVLQAHARLLGQLMLPDGRAYWADTVRQTPFVGYLPEEAVFGLVLDMAQILKTWDLKKIISDPVKREIGARLAELGGHPALPAKAARAHADEVFRKFRKEDLDPVAETLVARAVLQQVGHRHLPLDREMQLLAAWIHRAEEIDSAVSARMCAQPLRAYCEGELEPDGEPASWLWMNAPEWIVAGLGRGFVVEAQVLRRTPTAS